MFHDGKCPKCEAAIPNVIMEAIPIFEGLKARWRGVSFLCPRCKTILGVGINPIAPKIDTVD